MKKIFLILVTSLFAFLSVNKDYHTFIDKPVKRLYRANDVLCNANYMTALDYSYLDKDSVYSFLLDGGLIINDKTVGSQIIESYYGNNYYMEGYNSCVFLNNNTYDILYFTLGYYNDKEIELSQDNYKIYLQDIIKEVENRKSDNSVELYDLTTQIYNNSTQHIIYKDGTTTKMCTYTIKMQIVRNTSNISNGLEVGSYTARSTVAIVPESNYSITNYSIECCLQNNLSYTSSSIVNSNTNQDINESVTNNNIQIECSVNSNNYGIQMGLSDVISFTSINENNTSTISTKLTSLSMKDNGWWLFQKSYSISDDNKYKLIVNWNKNGFLNQQITN